MIDTSSETVTALAAHCIRGGIANADRTLVADTLRALTAERDALKLALDAQRKAAVDYCWMRYKDRPPLNLKSGPAAFTSHEWQKIGEAMDAATAPIIPA